MKFGELIEDLQTRKENKGYIIFVRCGIFFSAVGKDAVIVNELLGLKTVCAKKEVCKCGIPVNSFKNYISKLKNSGYSYVIYNYDKNNNYREIARIEGKMIEEERTCVDCLECSNYKNNFENSIDSNIKMLEEMLNEGK